MADNTQTFTKQTSSNNDGYDDMPFSIFWLQLKFGDKKQGWWELLASRTLHKKLPVVKSWSWNRLDNWLRKENRFQWCCSASLYLVSYRIVALSGYLYLSNCTSLKIEAVLITSGLHKNFHTNQNTVIIFNSSRLKLCLSALGKILHTDVDMEESKKLFNFQASNNSWRGESVILLVSWLICKSNCWY